MADAHANFAYSTVLTAPSPATSGTSLVVASNDGGKFPAVPFNATVWPAGAQPTTTNAEIVRVTNRSTDTLTITRAQEGTTARTIVTGDQIAATLSNKSFADLENVVALTVASYQNRQFALSSAVPPGQNSVWLAPFIIPQGVYVSASSFEMMESFTGTFTSNVAATWAQTIRWAIYSNNTTNSTRLDTWISGSMTAKIYNSSSNSISYDWDGTTTSSNNSNLASQITGLRIMTEAVGSLVPPGLYAFGYAVSTSTAGYSAVIRTTNMLMDSPMAVAHGLIGAATNASIGYEDGGTYSATSGAMPASIALTDIKQTMNMIPYFRIGAV